MEGLIEDEKLTIVSSEGDEFHILQSVAEESKLLETMISNDKVESKFSLPSAPSRSLKEAIKFMEYHHTNPLPKIIRPASLNLSESVPEWYANFIKAFAPFKGENLSDPNVEKEHRESAIKIMELVNCANYMDVRMLMELGCAHVASYMRRVRAVEPQHEALLLNILQMDKPMTEKEIKYIKKDTAWAEPGYDPELDDFSDLNLDD
jgi:hypothetical protein